MKEKEKRIATEEARVEMQIEELDRELSIEERKRRLAELRGDDYGWKKMVKKGLEVGLKTGRRLKIDTETARALHGSTIPRRKY